MSFCAQLPVSCPMLVRCCERGSDFQIAAAAAGSSATMELSKWEIA